MSNQSKVTDFFAAQKKTENVFRSAKKVNQSITHSATNESDVCLDSIPTVKTPKRKKMVTNDKSLKSSKRKKTPKTEVIIDFKTNKIEAKEETVVSEDKAIPEEKTSKQMTAKEVKEKLLKCNNLFALKKQLSTINDCAAKVKQFKEIKVKTPTKKVFRTPTKQSRSPSKHSPKRAMVSNTPITPIPPLKSPSRITPSKDLSIAQTYRRRLFDVFEDDQSSPQKLDNQNDNQKLRSFERFSYLVDKTEDSLVLPQKFKVLSEFFKAVDTIVSMHYKRQEVCTFDKLKVSVERMTSRKFDTKKLSQIQTVLSNAFKLKYDLVSSILSNQKPSYQLVITPIYNSNVDIRLNSTHLLERHQMFVNKLLDITKGYHKKFLNGLGITVEDKDLIRWHPKFRLDSVPDIEPNDNSLPSEPKFGEKSAEVFLENTRQRLGLPSTATSDTNTDHNSNDNQNLDNKTTTDSNKKITKGLLKGISMDLLNKVLILLKEILI